MSDAESTGGGSDDGQKPKKTKIDLKSRLSSVRATGATGARGPDDALAFPPPPAVGTVPPPRMLSQAGASYVPPPTSSAFASAQAEAKAAAAQPQTIKVEEGEILEERKRGAKKVRNAALAAAGVALLGGFLLGKLYEGGAGARNVKDGAPAVMKDVEGAVTTLKDLSDQVRKADDSMKAAQFPDELSTFVRDNKVNFDPNVQFDKASVRLLPKELVVKVVKFTQGVEDVNARLGRLSSRLNNPAAKTALTKFWETKKAPLPNFSVMVEKRGDDFLASLAVNKDPSALKASPLPAAYVVTKLRGASDKAAPKEQEAKRLAASVKLEDGQPYLIPISGAPRVMNPDGLDPESVKDDFDRELYAIRGLLENTPTPDGNDEKPGLIKIGEDIADALRKLKK